MRRQHSLRTIIILVFTLVIACVLLAQLAFNHFFAESAYTSYTSQVMEDVYARIKAGYTGQEEDISTIVSDYEERHNLSILVRANDAVVYATVYRQLGQMGIPNRPDADSLPNSWTDDGGFLENPITNISKSHTDGPRLLHLNGTFDYDGAPVEVSITLPVASIQSSVQLFTTASIRISLSVLLIGILLVLLFSKRVSRLVAQLEQTTSRLAKLDFSTRLEENLPTREVSDLARSINSMSDQLELAITDLNAANEKLQADIDLQKKLEASRRQFVANVSHEMKTPLALLQMYASNLRMNVENLDRDYYLDTIVEETDNLSDMVSSMLEISNIESGLTQMVMEPLSLSTLTQSVVEKTALLLDEHQLKLICDADVDVVGDRKYLEQAMKNLLTNAREHTPTGGVISVTLHQRDDCATLSIWNEGSHIADVDLPHIWDSFYRSDKARVREHKNIGLGLHIVQLIAKKHDGTISAENLDGGVRFTLTIPQRTDG